MLSPLINSLISCDTYTHKHTHTHMKNMAMVSFWHTTVRRPSINPRRYTIRYANMLKVIFDSSKRKLAPRIDADHIANQQCRLAVHLPAHCPHGPIVIWNSSAIYLVELIWYLSKLTSLMLQRGRSIGTGTSIANSCARCEGHDHISSCWRSAREASSAQRGLSTSTNCYKPKSHADKADLWGWCN